MDRLKQAFTDEPRNMTHNCAKDYSMLLIQNIVNEKFSGSYDPLNERYEEWKSQHGGESGFWKLWGDLLRAISIRSTPKGFTVGIEKDVLPSKSSSMGKIQKITPIWEYAYYGEMGRGQSAWSKGQPARAVFKPSAEEYRLIFLGKRRREAFDKIRRAW